MSVKLGDKVVDSISKIKGTVTAIADYLYGCRRVCIETTKKDKNSGEIEILEYWFDEQRVTPDGKKPKAKSGGPQSIPAKMSVPK